MTTKTPTRGPRAVLDHLLTRQWTGMIYAMHTEAWQAGEPVQSEVWTSDHIPFMKLTIGQAPDNVLVYRALITFVDMHAMKQTLDWLTAKPH